MEFFCNDQEWLALTRLERRRTVLFRVLAGLTPAVFTLLCLLTLPLISWVYQGLAFGFGS